MLELEVPELVLSIPLETLKLVSTLSFYLTTENTLSFEIVATENIGLWQPEQGYYEQSTTDIWRCICQCVHRALDQHNIDPTTIRGIGFDATCSLAVFSNDTDEPVPVTGPNFE